MLLKVFQGIFMLQNFLIKELLHFLLDQDLTTFLLPSGREGDGLRGFFQHLSE